jgi:hypothetical protein
LHQQVRPALVRGTQWGPQWVLLRPRRLARGLRGLTLTLLGTRPLRPRPRSLPSPLSDARLQPRRTRLMIGLSLLLALALAAGVFVTVPRGVTIGTLNMHSIRMHFNASTMVRAPAAPRRAAPRRTWLQPRNGPAQRHPAARVHSAGAALSLMPRPQVHQRQGALF